MLGHWLFQINGTKSHCVAALQGPEVSYRVKGPALVGRSEPATADAKGIDDQPRVPLLREPWVRVEPFAEVGRVGLWCSVPRTSTDQP